MSRWKWLLLTVLLAGCPAAHSDYPTRSCKLQADCYVGETCVLNASGGTCEPDDGGTP